MEEYSGAYMRLLHNVFRVNWANIVLASDTPTTPVQADRDVTQFKISETNFCKSYGPPSEWQSMPALPIAIFPIPYVFKSETVVV